MEEAKTASKPVFVFFGFDGCNGCRKLYSETLSDKKLRETFQKDFVLAYVDTTGHGEPASYQIGDGPALSHDELMSKFKGSPTPSWVFLTSKGIRLHGERGGENNGARTNARWKNRT